jgi:arsenite-transporting ATPase
LLSRRVLFFGGKGGVGKTTCAAALALAASRAGRRVLLVSIDPAHSTSDIFQTRLGPAEREILPGLTGLEIDPDTEVRRYLDDARHRMGGLFPAAVLREATRQMELTATMPGVADVAVFDRVADLIVGRGLAFDLVVFDTAPTGHALRVLRLPDQMASWVEALGRRRRLAVEAEAVAAASAGAAADPVLAVLDGRARRLAAVRDELRRSDRVTFVLVLLAERLPIEESARAVRELEAVGIHIGGVVINRILPDGEPGDYLRARKAQERAHVAEIARRFPTLPHAFVPQLASDVHGVAALARVGSSLLADSPAGG